MGSCSRGATRPLCGACEHGFSPLGPVCAAGGYATAEPRDAEGNAATGGLGPKGDIYYPKLLQLLGQVLTHHHYCQVVMQEHLEDLSKKY